MRRSDQRKYHYIYKVTRIDGSGRFYIGMHSTDDLDDGYFGSGKIITASIKKYGKKKHIKEILEYLPSREELRLREKQLVNEELLDDARCMNVKGGGEGNPPRGHWKTEPMWLMISTKLKKHWSDPIVRDQASRKMSEHWSNPLNREAQSRLKKAQYESQDLRDKIGETSKHVWSNARLREDQRDRKIQHWQDPEYRSKTIEAQNTGKQTPKFIEAQRTAKLGNKNPNFGTHWIHNPELKQSMRVLNTEVPVGWTKGRKMFNRTKVQDVE